MSGALYYAVQDGSDFSADLNKIINVLIFHGRGGYVIILTNFCVC